MARFVESTSITVKAVIIAFIILILLVPLTMLRGLVNERASMREQAYARVAEGWGGDIVIGGPMLVVPTERVVLENDKQRVLRTSLYVLPSQLDAQIDLQLEPEPRHVGIYAVPVYQSVIKLSGHFDAAAIDALPREAGVTYLWHQARIRLPLSASRSLREVREARFNSSALTFVPAGSGPFRGVDSPLDLTAFVETRAAEFSFQAVVAGSRAISLLPVGSTTSVSMQSTWPHPSFDGAFLPVEHAIANDGFRARWQVLELNRAYGQSWFGEEVTEATLLDSSIRIGLYQAVDVYQRAERAIKYALLFIALTFLTFFAWEQLSGLRLHPLQYFLVGLALSMFYVLLIALSEHLRFVIAYGIAAIALVTLMGAYISGALASRCRGMVVATAMSVVYGLLYALILSEDYALLMGAVTLFASLAAVMLATRKIDWYRVSSSTAT